MAQSIDIKSLKVFGKDNVFKYYEPERYEDCNDEYLIGYYNGDKFSIYIRVGYYEFYNDIYRIQIASKGMNYINSFVNFKDAQKVLDRLLDIIGYAEEKYPDIFKVME